MSDTTTVVATDLASVDLSMVTNEQIAAILARREAELTVQREQAKQARLFRKVRAHAVADTLVSFFTTSSIPFTTSTPEWGTGWNIGGSKIVVNGQEYRLNLSLRLEESVPERPAKD